MYMSARVSLRLRLQNITSTTPNHPLISFPSSSSDNIHI